VKIESVSPNGVSIQRLEDCLCLRHLDDGNRDSFRNTGYQLYSNTADRLEKTSLHSVAVKDSNLIRTVLFTAISI
jgi:hypothetical protein